jgi:hypothetical protein
LQQHLSSRKDGGLDRRCGRIKSSIHRRTAKPKLLRLEQVRLPNDWRNSRLLPNPYLAYIGSGAQSVRLETISLNDLLPEAKAPSEIDFLSVDTEGPEPEILGAFDFERWNVHCVALEHNHTPNRNRLFELLTARGTEVAKHRSR